MLASLFYALFFYRRQLSVLRIFAAKFTVNLVVNVLLGALWSALLYGKGYLYTVTASILKNVVLLPLELESSSLSSTGVVSFSTV